MLSANQIEKRYGKKTVLNRISLDLEQKNYGLLGSNGAGKTTLIRILAQILAKNGGTVTYFDKNHREIPRKNYQIGYMPQTFEAILEFRVMEQMQYFASLKKIPKSEQDEAIQKALELVNLTEQAGYQCRKLSGGMMQRLGIAQAILGSPDLILFDEPTTGLDPEERLRFKGVMRALEGTCTVILSTHIVEDMEAVCSEILVLKEGQKQFSGAAETLKNLARDRVFLLPDGTIRGQSGSWFEIRSVMEEYKRYSRMLYLGTSPKEAEKTYGAKPVEPTLEDGYMYLIKKK